MTFRYQLGRWFLLWIVVCGMLWSGLYLCDQAAVVTLHMVGDNKTTRIQVGDEELRLADIGIPIALYLADIDPLVHEFQIDGTDSANNFTQDTEYLKSIEKTPQYTIFAWMRNLDGLSQWRSVQVQGNEKILLHREYPKHGEKFTFPTLAEKTQKYTINLQLQRPETPRNFSVLMNDGGTLEVTVNRNDRFVQVEHETKDGTYEKPLKVFFPTDSLPFAAMVLSTVLKVLLCAWTLLLVIPVTELLFVPLYGVLNHLIRTTQSIMQKWIIGTQPSWWKIITEKIHPIGLVALVSSFLWVAWIARVQFQAEPHIFDASAYFFAAKMYAQGELAMPASSILERFPGPFMNVLGGKWFGQYPPGTGLALVPGIWLGLPWIMEPLLGTLALLGCGFVATQLYNRRVATLVVLLGVLSPFYSYLSATYMSHAVTLCYLVWALYFFIRFLQGKAGWHLAISAVLLGMAWLTRDSVTILFALVSYTGIWFILRNQGTHQGKRRWILPGLSAIAVIWAFALIGWTCNLYLTGNPWITPRTVFFSGDRWGFGPGVGFYGQHTLAAGLVNLDQLLTSLSTHLYGWPFTLTLSFCVVPFLTGRAKSVDWYALACLMLIGGSFVGYFYHGIYLGPRYFFELLPFLLMLTARGIFVLASVCSDRRILCEKSLWPTRELLARKGTSIATTLLVCSCIAYNITYYWPRQIAIHHNFSGLPVGQQVDLQQIYNPSLKNAIIVTDDFVFYQMVMFPLNDPQLKQDVLYAFAQTAEHYAQLHKAFPSKVVYRLYIGLNGSVSYTKIQ